MIRWFWALVAACALAAGCASNDSTTGVPTQPASFADATNVETFTGTLTIAGTDSHPFSVPVPGVVNVTLTALDPPIDPSAPITLSIGLPSTTVIGQCATVTSVAAVPAKSPQITGHALAGAFCVAVSDPSSTLTATETYTVVVAHP